MCCSTPTLGQKTKQNKKSHTFKGEEGRGQAGGGWAEEEGDKRKVPEGRHLFCSRPLSGYSFLACPVQRGQCSQWLQPQALESGSLVQTLRCAIGP